MVVASLAESVEESLHACRRVTSWLAVDGYDVIEVAEDKGEIVVVSGLQWNGAPNARSVSASGRHIAEFVDWAGLGVSSKVAGQDDGGPKICWRWSSLKARKVAMLVVGIWSGSGCSERARLTVLSRSTCSIGYGERFVTFSGASRFVPAN